MDPDVANTFAVLSAIAGPALLTNATSLLTLSTTNRFARAVDRSRFLLAEIGAAPAPLRPLLRRDLAASQHRARVIARAMGGLYLAAGMFALATMLAIGGAVLQAFGISPRWGLDTMGAAAAGGIGFVALVVATFELIRESRLSLAALTIEAEEADLRLSLDSRQRSGGAHP
ncbi:MAG: DUF2721 domain-containing protein [Pseudomonadota bacterium]